MSANPVTKIPLLPPEIADALAEFLAKGRTGNIQLNIKDGQVLGAHVEEFLSVKTGRPRSRGA